MTSAESSIERAIAEFSESDATLRTLYAELRELQSVSRSHERSQAGLESAAAAIDELREMSRNQFHAVSEYRGRLDKLLQALDAAEVASRLSQLELSTTRQAEQVIRLTKRVLTVAVVSAGLSTAALIISILTTSS